MSNLLVFAGTTEGRILLETLSRSIGSRDINVHACVATDYGKAVIPADLAHITLSTGRMTAAEMFALMKEQQFDCVIDTTHPYATLVSENIRSACSRSGSLYIRLLRSSSLPDQWEKKEGFVQSSDGTCLLFADHASAAEYLNQTTGNVLMTIGSKSLAAYTKVKDYQDRLFARVLPMAEVLQSCHERGYAGKQLICMQGPFSKALNMAMMEQIQAAYLVTKDSGETGGFQEKWQAAQAAGAKLLIIGREQQEEGFSLPELLPHLENLLQLPAFTLRRLEHAPQMQEKNAAAVGSISTHLAGTSVPAAETDLGQWFPFFLDISQKKFVVVGGGKIAQRRIRTLLRFRCNITIVAEEIAAEIAEWIADSLQVTARIKAFSPEDLEDADYVLAATNNKEVNQQIYLWCKEKKIAVNVADNREKCDFYFPGIVREHGVTAGITAEGKNHQLAKKATGAVARCLATLTKEGE